MLQVYSFGTFECALTLFVSDNGLKRMPLNVRGDVSHEKTKR